MRERFVAASLLENALIASEGIFPICQDTGTALVYGWRGDHVDIAGENDMERLLAAGAREAYAREKLRNSIRGPLTMIEERNTNDNLPAGIQIRSVSGHTIKLLCIAKGGGSTSRASLTMESPSLLRPERLEEALRSKIRALGASGCPPYTITVVLGGTSPSETMYISELAAVGALDSLPESATGDGAPLRDRAWEEKILEIARESGIGAQWGGVHMAASARAIRLSRHAANLPFAVAVSCAANRHVAVIIDRDGWHIQRLGIIKENLEFAFEEINHHGDEAIQLHEGVLQRSRCQ
jgi:fumarate hydratase class I